MSAKSKGFLISGGGRKKTSYNISTTIFFNYIYIALLELTYQDRLIIKQNYKRAGYMTDVTMPMLDITNEQDIFNDAKRNLIILNNKNHNYLEFKITAQISPLVAVSVQNN